MLKQSFEDIIKNLKTSIADYNYYVSFDKAYKNSQEMDANLRILNKLIGSQNIEHEFKNLLEENPQVINSIPSLLAVHNHKLAVIDQKLIEYNFNHESPMLIENYVTFMRKTGLFDLLSNTMVHDLRDYHLGIEVGMDTNARKNRTGATMEKIVENFIIKANPQEYYKQLSKKEISRKFHINLDNLIFAKEGKREANKRFDFVIKNNDQIYLIETNFYGSSGSKLNEVSRSFKSLNNSLKNLPNIHFVWITDGIGWKQTKNNFSEAYQEIEHLYTLYDLEKGVLEKIFSN